MEGKFLLTHYLYPLETPIVLSEKLGIILENLKDETEIEYLHDCIKISMDNDEQFYAGPSHKLRLPLDGPEEILTVKSGIREFISRNQHNSYVKRFFKENSNINEWKLLAKLWIVIRYDASEVSPLFKSVSDKELIKFFYPGDENPFYESIINYGYILSLFIKSRSFIRPELSYLFLNREPDVMFNSVIFFFSAIHIKGYQPQNDEVDFDFSSVREELIGAACIIEKMLDLNTAQKLLYIGNLLRIVDERHTDIRIKFTTLVSIIELLLTHNPDFNRFNVEDSISKQFKLKTAILIHMSEKSTDLELIKNTLQIIYNQRSNIAHGNFSEFQKFLQKASESDSFPMESFYNLTEKLYNYVRIVVLHYIKDTQFVNFLKYN